MAEGFWENNFKLEIYFPSAATTNSLENQCDLPRVLRGFPQLVHFVYFFSRDKKRASKKIEFPWLTKKVERLEYTLAHVFRHDQSSNAKPNSSADQLPRAHTA